MLVTLFVLALGRAIVTFGAPTSIDVPVANDHEVVVIVGNANCPTDRDAQGEYLDDPCYSFATREDGGALVIETGP
jgi:hypothetical protein